MDIRTLGLVVLLVPAVSFAGPSPAARTGHAPPPVDAAGTVCEMRKPTGSRIAVEVCTTAEERVALREKAHRDLHQWGRCAGNENPCIEIL
jgi:hypothetical protein